MEPDRWRKIEELFHAALERDESQRAAFLEEACAGDPAMRAEVESLLAHHHQGEGLIDQPAFEVAAKALARQGGQAEDQSRARGSTEKASSMVGRTVSHYQILEKLGSGGMGEVYRARDTRLGREVAIKVLPAAFSGDTDRLRRFEQEARAASALNHPNIVTIYDIGQEGSAPYMAMEMVEGKTLRGLLTQDPVPLKKLLRIATQVADGLAKAHAAGIVHRDLKPENLMVTKDGLVKILDFGLAKLSQREFQKGEGSQALTVESATHPGVVMGTAGYMSPEQASGLPVDFRSDQFSFGAILYEMTTGKRAFKRGTAVQTLSAIIQDEPEPIAAVNPKTPPPLRWMIERCLAKNVEDRYGSTRDLARDLQSLGEHLTEVGGAESAILTAAPVSTPRKVIGKQIGLAVAALGIVVGAVVFDLGRRAEGPPPTFRPLTFRHGVVTNARFARDGESVIYSAAWSGSPVEVFTTRPESPESRSLGLRGAGVFAVSPSGEIAVAVGCTMNWGTCIGTLARVPPTGGAPREVLEHVHEADWSPDGQNLLAAQLAGGKDRLQYPIGRVLYEAPGWITFPRMSPKGDLIAFCDHPILGDISGSVSVMDLTGKKKALSSGWKAVQGLAWSPSGDEVWFTGSRTGKGGGLGLYAVTLSGTERPVSLSPSALRIEDISRDGKRVLVMRGTPRAAMISLTPGVSKEHDLAWFDYSTAADLSPDGRTLLFYEWGDGVKGNSTVYLRKTDGSDAVQLGQGKPLALSPDGKWALTLQQTSPPQLALLPTGPGEQKLLPRGSISEYYDWAAWSPDHRQIFFAAAEAGHRPRTYVQEMDGGPPRPVTAEGMVGTLLSPDGKLIAAIDRYLEYYLCPVNGGEPRAIEGLAEGDVVLQWTADGRSLFVRGAGDLVLRIFKFDLGTGHREAWKELRPPDPAPVIGIGVDPGQVRLTPDGKYYVYTSWTFPSELYLAEGLK